MKNVHNGRAHGKCLISFGVSLDKAYDEPLIAIWIKKYSLYFFVRAVFWIIVLFFLRNLKESQ